MLSLFSIWSVIYYGFKWFLPIHLKYFQLQHMQNFPHGSGGKEPTCQWTRHKRSRFDPWAGKVPWRRAWQPTPVFLPGKSSWTEEPGGLQSIALQRVRHDWSDLAQHSTANAICQNCSSEATQRQNVTQFFFKLTLLISQFCRERHCFLVYVHKWSI